MFLKALTFWCFAAFGAAQPINVHIVPHSHDDTGWLKTVTQYYEGTNNTIQRACVRCIIDTVVEALVENSERKYIQVEIAFFQRWWEEQNEQTRDIVRGLVQNRQLEFINAGWCMNDEATVHHVGVIDQHTLGHDFLSRTFGVVPRVAYHIDPFGHSSTHATMYADMGFEAFIINRVDYADKERRLQDREMEMIWRPSRSRESNSEIFTHLTYNHYSPPPGFCFDDVKCNDPPLNDTNIAGRANAFLQYCLTQGSYYRTNNIMILMGDDFHYEHADSWYDNLDLLIGYIRSNPGFSEINVFYSSPSIYIDAVQQSGYTDWPIKTDDFYPYGDRPHSYWTGYFTTRPTFKGFGRESNAYLQAARQLDVFDGPRTADLSSLEQAVGVIQHHDGLTGTNKQHVDDDYRLQLAEAVELVDEEVNLALGVLTNTSTPDFQHCHLRNISICEASSSPGLHAVIIYNSLAFARTQIVKIPVPNQNCQIFNGDGEVISQIVPGDNPYPPGTYADAQPYNLLFDARIPSLGFRTYFLNVPVALKAHKGLFIEPKPIHKEDIVLENNFLSVIFDGESGRMKSVRNKVDQVEIAIDQNWLYYRSSIGNQEDGQASGAYIFRPNGTDPFDLTSQVEVTVSNGPVVREVHQKFGPYVTQIVRLSEHSTFVELEHTIGPIPIDDDWGKEIIVRFDTNLDTEELYYTDSNCREMQPRRRNFRETWDLEVTEPVSQNYYPINCAASIKDVNSGAQLIVLSDRNQGGGSLVDGSLEIMVHRRCLRDDGRGVGEALLEPDITGEGLISRGKNYLIVGSPLASELHKTHQEEITYPARVVFRTVAQSIPEYISGHVTSFSGGILPPSIHLTTLKRIDETQVLVRLAHKYEVDEHPIYSSPVQVNFATTFPTLTITEVQELSLSANRLRDEIKTFNWSTSKFVQRKGTNTINVIVNPMEIKTFMLTVTK